MLGNCFLLKRFGFSALIEGGSSNGAVWVLQVDFQTCCIELHRGML